MSYRSTIESILSGCITAWYGNSTTADRKALQRVHHWVQDTYNTRCHRKAKKMKCFERLVMAHIKTP